MPSNLNSNKKIWHIVIGGTIGNITEWYNFLLYSYLATVISKEFFPLENELLSLTLTFTLFALSFVVRPIGGILFGWIGDTYGRQRALLISLFMMAIPTFIIGCLPTYKSIGLISPILLCICRILQGLSAGGEHTGSAIYMAEHAPPSRRALWITTVPTSAALGILFSSAMSLLIVSCFTSEQLLAGGWRVGFWIGTLLCIISIALRVGLPETPAFLKSHEKKSHERYPISALLRNKAMLKNLLIVTVLAGSWGIFYQILFIWMPTYLSHFLHLSNSLALQINSAYLLLFSCLVLGVGYLADRLNLKLLLTSACMAMLISAYPLFLLLSSGELWQVCTALAIFTLIFSVYLPTAFVTMIELFSVEIRFTALSLGFNTGLAIFGGTCPLVVTWLIEMTGKNTAPATYMMLAAVSALLMCIVLQGNKGNALVNKNVFSV
jgi:MHS family proline/betaine transporter-like MFS transporter